jgi:hypothetical protein
VNDSQIERPYFFEVFTALNFIILFFAYPAAAGPMTATFLPVFGSFVICFAVQLLIGMSIRLGVAHRRGTWRELLATYRSRVWLADTARMTVFTGLCVHAYTWIKLTTPILHPRLYDQQLWNLDRALAFGYSPTVFLATLFSAPVMMRFFDATYATVLFPALSIVPAFIASIPARRVRIAFVNSNTLLWLTGAWLYVVFPALGPAYRFPEVWLPLAPMLTNSHHVQRLLIENYRAVQVSMTTATTPINVFFGVAAFPSLHVGFQALSFFWMRRLTRWGGVVFGMLALLALIGSVITGWHYLVDGIAGALLAWTCYAAVRYVPALRVPAIGTRVDAFKAVQSR